MDKVGADYDFCYQSILDRLGAPAVPVVIPVGKAETFRGVIDLISKVVYLPEKYGDDKDKGQSVKMVSIDSLSPEDKASYDKYRALLPDAVPIEVCTVCMSKVSTQLKLLELDPNCTHLPPGGVVYERDALPSAAELAAHRKPFYLKADVGQAKEGRGAVAMRCETVEDLLRAQERHGAFNLCVKVVDTRGEVAGRRELQRNSSRPCIGNFRLQAGI